MIARDVATLERRLNSLARSAGRIANHLDDLHALAYEPASSNTEPDRSGFESRPPPGWRADTGRAHELFGELAQVVIHSEEAIVELERRMMAIFFAGSSSPQPSRGSLISAEEHTQLLAKQQARSGPIRIVDQPHHPAREIR